MLVGSTCSADAAHSLATSKGGGQESERSTMARGAGDTGGDEGIAVRGSESRVYAFITCRARRGAIADAPVGDREEPSLEARWIDLG